MSDPSKEINDDQLVGQKLWFKPHDPAKYKTYIDHDCKIDDQGYPLFPNGSTTFVQLPEAKIMNFGSVGFVKHLNLENKKDWKIVRIKCLGVVTCDGPQCQWVGPPPTGRNTMEAYLQW